MPNGKPTVTQDEKLYGGLSYLWVISVIVLIVKKDSPFVKFHATQGLVLFILAIIFAIIPVVGWILNIVLTIVIIVALLKALQGEKWEIPVIGQIAKKINL